MDMRLEQGPEQKHGCTEAEHRRENDNNKRSRRQKCGSHRNEEGRKEHFDIK